MPPLIVTSWLCTINDKSYMTWCALTQTVCKAIYIDGLKTSVWWVGQGCGSCSNAQQVSQCLNKERICNSLSMLQSRKYTSFQGKCQMVSQVSYIYKHVHIYTATDHRLQLAIYSCTCNVWNSGIAIATVHAFILHNVYFI